MRQPLPLSHWCQCVVVSFGIDFVEGYSVGSSGGDFPSLPDQAIGKVESRSGGGIDILDGGFHGLVVANCVGRNLY